MENNNIQNLIYEIAYNYVNTNNFKKHKEHTPYKRNALYKDKTVKKINHKTSETFFTDEYLHLLELILESPEAFEKLTPIEKQCIQSEIELLSHDDYNLKMYLHRSTTEPLLHEIFGEYYSIFKKDLITNILKPEITTQRGDKTTFKYRLRLFYKEIISLLIEEGYDLQRINTLTEKEVDEICDKLLQPKEIFNLFCTQLLKHAKDSLFSSQANVFDEHSMFVSKHTVINTIYTHTIILLLSHCIFYKSVYKSKKGVPIESLLRSIKTYILHNIDIILAKSETKSLVDSITGMFNSFVHCGLFQNVSNEWLTHNKIQTKLYFRTQLSNQLGKFTIPPRVVTATKVTENNLLEFIIPSSFGNMKITASHNLLKTLNISNEKRFKINVNFMKILHLLEGKYSHLNINRPIPSIQDIDKIAVKRDLLNIQQNKLAFIFMKEIEQLFVKKQKTLKTNFQYNYATDVTTMEAKCWVEWRTLCDVINEKLLVRKGGLTRLQMANVLEGYPLYYTNTICSTTRCFAREYTLSRHIGCLKLLRCNYKEKRVTLIGLINIMLAYYNEDPVLKAEFHSFLRDAKGQHTRDGLYKFYKKHRIDYASKEAVTYYILLSVELTQLFIRKKTTGIMLQLDQVSSGLAFMAILFKNDELAYRTFVNVKDESLVKKSLMYDHKPDIDSAYEYALKSFEEFYNENILHKNERVLQLFIANKKIHKYALMCYSYNQTNFGRTQDFISKFKEAFGMSPDTDEWDCVCEIAEKYDQFINKLFPSLNTLIELLNSMVELVAKDSNSIRIRSLDGEILEWKFFKRKREIRKTYSPLDMTPKSYALSTAVMNTDGSLVTDIRQFKIKFLSYLVHSLDAGVMRQIVRKMNDIPGTCVVDQLHDCVMVHPNDVQHFYDVVHTIYTSEELTDYLNSHVFEVFKQSISQDKLIELEDLIGRFEETRNKPIKPYTPDYMRMYSFES